MIQRKKKGRLPDSFWHTVNRLTRKTGTGWTLPYARCSYFVHCIVGASKVMWVATVLPRALRIKSPLHRCNACDPKGGSRRACSPFHGVERSVFETVPARLSGSTSIKWSLRQDSHLHLTAYETAALLIMLRSGKMRIRVV